MIENRDDIEIVEFIEVGEFFEEKNHVMGLVEINCGVDKLIEGCGAVKVDAIINVEKVKEKYGDVGNLNSGNYDFMVLGNFLGDMDELNYREFDEEWVNMFEFFDKRDRAKKLFDKYKFRSLPCVKMKMEINYKLEFHIIYIATELFKKIQARDDIGDDKIKSLV